MRRLILTLSACLLLTGCMHSKNLDEYAYVLNVGVERGTTMPYSVTVLVSAPETGGDGTEVKNVVLSAEARTFSEAVATMNAAYPSRLSFARTSLLLLSEELVREGAQTAFLDFAFFKADLWQNLRMAVTNSAIAETFEGWVSDSDPSLRKIKTSVGELSARSGLSADIGCSSYLECVRDGRIDALIAYAGVNEWDLRADMTGSGAYPVLGGSLLVESPLKTTTAGSAVFDGDRMVGVLDGRHTMAVLMVTGAFKSGELLFPMPDGQQLSVKLYRVRKPKIALKGDTATVRLYLEADIVGPETVPMTSEELKALLKARLEEMLMRVFLALRETNSDAMGFGRFAAKRFLTAEDWEAFDWKAAYRSLDANFTVFIKLAHNPREPILE